MGKEKERLKGYWTKGLKHAKRNSVPIWFCPGLTCFQPIQRNLTLKMVGNACLNSCLSFISFKEKLNSEEVKDLL